MTVSADLPPPASVASPQLAAAVRALIAERGPVRASRALGLARQTVIALASGAIVVRPGSIAMAQQRIAQLHAADAHVT